MQGDRERFSDFCAIICSIKDVGSSLAPLLASADVDGRHTERRRFVNPTARIADERCRIAEQVDESIRGKASHDLDPALMDFPDDPLRARVVIRIDQHTLELQIANSGQRFRHLPAGLLHFGGDGMLQDHHVGPVRIEPVSCEDFFFREHRSR